MKQRFRVECETVATVIAIATKAVCEGEQLPHNLVVGDDAVVITDASAAAEPQQEPKVPAAPTRQPLAPGLLTLDQIRAFVAAARRITTCEFMRVSVATDVLQSMAILPAEWRRVTWKQMHDGLAAMDAHASGYLDWVELATCLVILSCPALQSATPACIAACARALDGVDGDGDGALTQDEWMACPLWFESSGNVARAHVDADRGIPGTRDELKDLLWHLFSVRRVQETPNTEEGVADGQVEKEYVEKEAPTETVLPITRALLYLSADREQPVALRRAFAVLAREAGPQVTVTTADIVKLLYPNGMVGKQIFKVPCTEDDVTAAVAAICGKQSNSNPEEYRLKSDQFVYNPRGARLLAICGSRYTLRDLFLDFCCVQPAD